EVCIGAKTRHNPPPEAASRQLIGAPNDASGRAAQALADAARCIPLLRHHPLLLGALMSVKIAVLKETRPNERRVAMVPAVADKLARLGAAVHMQSDAGAAVKLPDSAYRNVTFEADAQALVRDADVVLSVQPPALDVVRAMKEGAILVSFIHAHKEPELTRLLRDRKITCFAMELVPRISRAQAMDALSSQAALAGYHAVLLGATRLS